MTGASYMEKGKAEEDRYRRAAESHSVQWKLRLLAYLQAQVSFDAAAEVFDMIHAALAESHSEGMRDAAEICRDVAARSESARRVGTILASAIMDCDALNRASKADGLRKPPPSSGRSEERG